MSKYRKAGVHTKHDLDDQREKKHFYTMLQTPFSETTIDEEIVPMFIYQRHKYLKHAQGTHLHTQNRTRRSRRHGIQNRALWKSLSREKKKERKKEKLQKALMIKQEPRSLPTSFHCVQCYGKQQTKKNKWWNERRIRNTKVQCRGSKQERVLHANSSSSRT